MTSLSVTRTSSPLLTDRQIYRLLFAATFAVFLVAVIIKRLGRFLGGHPGGADRSILADARETASSTLLFAFMG